MKCFSGAEKVAMVPCPPASSDADAWIIFLMALGFFLSLHPKKKELFMSDFIQDVFKRKTKENSFRCVSIFIAIPAEYYMSNRGLIAIFGWGGNTILALLLEHQTFCLPLLSTQASVNGMLVQIPGPFTFTAILNHQLVLFFSSPYINEQCFICRGDKHASLT